MTTASQVLERHATSKARPFLKWAGGKSQLLSSLLPLVPTEFGQYIEPFIGGGAMFFAIGHHNSVISDSNDELILTYRTIRDQVEAVIGKLNELSNDRDSFYEIRSWDISTVSDIERAARLIYLNKTCFNGLYRVNKKGHFNVPYNGSEGKSVIQGDALRNASIALSGVEIRSGDYKDTLAKFAKSGDFVFLDPPYQPVGKYSDFKRYTKEFFYEHNQVELANEFQKLVALGCKVILTNSSHPFILELYKDFELETVKTKRLISSNADTRDGEDLIVLGGF